MKPILIFLILWGITSAIPDIPELGHYLADGFEVLDHKFGALHLSKETEEGTDQIVVWPKGGMFSELEHFEDHNEMLVDRQKNPVNITDAIEQCDIGSRPDYLKVFPAFVGNVLPGALPISYTAPCFTENSISAEIVDEETIIIRHKVSKASSLTCNEAYFYATTQNYHMSLYLFRGEHKITFKHLTQTQYYEMVVLGINVFRFCDSLYNDLPDVFLSLELFLGGLGTNPNIPFFGSKPPEYMVENNVKFIKEATGYQWQERPKAAQDTVYNLDPSLVHSGDFFAVTRLDGLDQIIEYGAGSHAGHSVVAMWIDDELYILESQAAWYWPRKNIQKNKFSQWIEWANNAGYHVTWLPLKEEYRAMFNNETALEWFNNVIGSPYGYHNFLFGWIDTANASYPPLLSVELIAPVFSIIEKKEPELVNEVYIPALNQRLGTENLTTVAEIAEEVARRNLSFAELYAMPENDEWIYYDGVSLVCSSFVVALYKHAGLFGNTTVQATEFTPRDVYQLTLIDPNPKVPEDCKALDPESPYCQIMGKYRMEFPGISTISPYDHMNEHCPSIPPLYDRVAGC